MWHHALAVILIKMEYDQNLPQVEKLTRCTDRGCHVGNI